ncbi:mucin-associated surface protein (MASP), putative [Trypanosoma cruzi marinkellei]|uniref:Mucin-associated surface protein (MASP), putative n=1 Tax=Trypanosoma cruzi marinkellei TaxID=85056 RepID=K2M370_TRYCR|nr:mucin-associated surface protein (MASP), putative [Trypanosoma cruzi marinkellei]
MLCGLVEHQYIFSHVQALYACIHKHRPAVLHGVCNEYSAEVFFLGDSCWTLNFFLLFFFTSVLQVGVRDSAPFFSCVVVYRPCLSFCCFSLCVDGLLVCAEGYTQVTGVMAMMMTGRVLLVCALCVLWCGAGSGGSAETTQVPSVPLSQDVDGPEIKNDTLHGSAGTGVQTDNQAALQKAAAQTLPQKEPEPEPEAKAALRTQAKASGTEIQGTAENELQKEDENGEDEEVEEGEDEEGEEEEEEEGAKEEKDDEKDTNTTKRMSAGGQEPTSLTSVEEGASNKTNLKNTQTLDDSDSSTAASHTTSPLLLLLVFACAAAAAVVAA